MMGDKDDVVLEVLQKGLVDRAFNDGPEICKAIAIQKAQARVIAAVRRGTYYWEDIAKALAALDEVKKG